LLKRFSVCSRELISVGKNNA